MYRKSKFKIVTALMSVLIVLFAVTLAAIYYSSYMEVFQRDTEMLSLYAKEYWQNGNPEGRLQEPPLPDAGDPAQSDRIYQLSTFYSVAFSDAGDVISIDNEAGTGITDQHLVELCRALIDTEKENGVRDSMVYHIEHNQNRTLIALMNNEVLSDNIATLFQNTVLFGVVAILLLLLPSVYFAHRIVQPLEQNYKKQKQFISDAGHELKTPIAVISTNAEMLEREFGQSKWLDNIKYENRQMGDRVHQLLELARVEHVVPKMTRLNFSRIVTGSALPFECIAFENEQTLQLLIQDDVYVLGNAEQLENLITNLLDNALEHSPKQKAIIVSLKLENHTAVLTVTNEGEALSESQKKSLFDRFYKTDFARSGNNEHYGLGLAIVKSIVTSHHGKISVACMQNQIIFTVSIPANL